MNLGGSDTSSGVCRGIFYDSSQDEKIYSQIFGIIDKYNLNTAQNEEEKEKILSEMFEDVQLDACMKEMIRMNTPFQYSTTRILTKNIKLGDLKFRKGDSVVYSLGLRHYSESLSKDLKEFRPERHLNKDEILQNK